MKTREIRVLNVPEKDLNDIKAIALALGTSNQAMYREALTYYINHHLNLVATGKDIMKTQAALRKE